MAFVSVGEMRGAGLRFHKVGRDGSGKCNAARHGTSGEAVLGAVYRLTREQVRILDGFESLGQGYERLVTDVRLASGRTRSCITYVAMAEFIDERLAPYSWYRALVARGARHHGFPADYLGALERWPAVEDTDERRAEQERRRLERMGTSSR